MQKRQGASTFQKVRTKKPSAQTHNKCKNAKGLRPFKRSETKNLRHKCKNAKGLRPFKRYEPKTNDKKDTISAKRRPTGRLGKIERWMPERGETFFLSEPSASIIRLSYEATPRKEGGRRFSQNATLPRVDSIGKQTIYRGTAKKKLRPGDDLVERGEMFFQE